jgi:hypothetical protein
MDRERSWSPLGLVLCLLLGAAVLTGTRQAGGAYPGANGKIAFETNRDGNLEI